MEGGIPLEKIILKGRGVIPGVAEGTALVCPHSITGWNGVDPKTGVITDFENENKGKTIKETILVMPGSKAPTAGPATLGRQGPREARRRAGCFHGSIQRPAWPAP